ARRGWSCARGARGCDARQPRRAAQPPVRDAHLWADEPAARHRAVGLSQWASGRGRNRRGDKANRRSCHHHCEPRTRPALHRGIEVARSRERACAGRLRRGRSLAHCTRRGPVLRHAMLDLRAALTQCPIAAILRGVTPDEVDAIGDALVEVGITIIEVPLNSPSPFESIERLAARHGANALIGAGTVLEAADVARVKDAGGRLMVAPNFDADVVRAARPASLPALPGVMAPSEGFAALKAGADGLKLFPAEIIPPAVFRAWRAVVPAAPLLLALGGRGAVHTRG